MAIRDATAQDAAAIAALHARSWRCVYRGTLPDAYLDGPLADDFDRHWRAAFDRPRGDDLVLVATAADRVIGFVAVWPDADDPSAAFIDNLHVDADRRGAGLGRALMAAAAWRLASRGVTSAYLWVVATNDGAIRFYRRLGGTELGCKTKLIHDHAATQIRFVWQDIEALAAACAKP